jgi:7,8-dihydroneopterin aldolase/epimerase/oxygenase
MDQIRISGISGFGFHGVYPEERRVGQRFLADLILYTDLSAPAKSDDVNDATDYSKVVPDVKRVLEGDPVNLIETLADRVVTEVLQNYPLVESVEVTIFKPEAPVEAAVAVHIRRNR